MTMNTAALDMLLTFSIWEWLCLILFLLNMCLGYYLMGEIYIRITEKYERRIECMRETNKHKEVCLDEI